MLHKRIFWTVLLVVIVLAGGGYTTYAYWLAPSKTSSPAYQTATVTRGDETFLLTENQSTYIPLGVTHRLENSGKVPLEIVEVQSGSYLGEDDIVRFEDRYDRTR